MFRRLVIGLIDEQVRVVQVVPEGRPDDELSDFGQKLIYPESSIGLVNRWRFGKLVEPMESEGVTMIHACDGPMWSHALMLGKSLEIPVLLDLRAESDLERLSKAMGQPMPVAILAATQPLMDEAKRRVEDRAVVELIHPGIHVPSEMPALERADETFCAAISGTGRFSANDEALFEGLSRVLKNHQDAQFFVESQSSDTHDLYRGAERFNLLAHVSFVPGRMGRREFFEGVDAVIHPEALGKARTVTLQAMGYGVPVIARQDSWLDYQVMDETAWIVGETSPTPWADLITRVIERRDGMEQLRGSAFEWVRNHHLASTQVEQTLNMYRRFSEESIQFPGSS